MSPEKGRGGWEAVCVVTCYSLSCEYRLHHTWHDLQQIHQMPKLEKSCAQEGRLQRDFSNKTWPRTQRHNVQDKTNRIIRTGEATGEVRTGDFTWGIGVDLGGE